MGPTDINGWVRQWEIVDLNGDDLESIVFATNKLKMGEVIQTLIKSAVPLLYYFQNAVSVNELNGENWHHTVGELPRDTSKPALALFSGYVHTNPDYAFSFSGDVAVRKELPGNLSSGNIKHLSHLSSQSSNKSFFFSDLRSSAYDNFC